MNRYRCGFDQIGQYRLLDEGKRALVPIDGKLFWYLGYGSSNLSRAVLVHLFEEVFKRWEAVLHPLSFVQTEEVSEVHIQLYFGAQQHSHLGACPFAFDGKKGILAHAFPTRSGQLSGHIHFDDAEQWYSPFEGTTPKEGIDLFQVALHEVGHVLGLGHSEVEEAIMYAYYDGSRQGLHADDVEGAQVLYRDYLRSSFWTWLKEWWSRWFVL